MELVGGGSVINEARQYYRQVLTDLIFTHLFTCFFRVSVGDSWGNGKVETLVQGVMEEVREVLGDVQVDVAVGSGPVES